MAAHDYELCMVFARMAMAGDGVVLGLGMTFLAIRTWLKFRSHSKALKEVGETAVFGVSDLRTFLDCTENEVMVRTEVLEKGVKPQEPRQKRDQLVIVRGTMQTRAALESQDSSCNVDTLSPKNAEDKAVYVERTQTYVYTEVSNLVGLVTRKDLIKVTKQMVPFVLVESEAHRHPHRQGEAVFVHVNMDGSQHSLPLVTVFYQLHPVPASSYTFLQAMFGRRYPVGLLDEEKILPLGREITAVGVVNMSSDGSPVIKSCNHLPVFLTQYTRDQLLAELSNGTKVLFWMGIAFSTVAAGVLCYSIVKNWAKWKQRQQRQQQRPQQDDEARHTMSTEEEPENSGDIPDEDLCVVCLLRRRQAAFIQCGHRVCCVPCAQRVEQGSNPLCPVCRQIVTSIVRVFDS
ncbi:unnamed protein product [Sphagnum troendelagicum]|uniref:RING-type E3 ubiquitin transferase n=1 Tax=Sphagnum troendelagicum TaxID=128251 RepID=A0ABP0UF49_9BRYO